MNFLQEKNKIKQNEIKIKTIMIGKIKKKHDNWREKNFEKKEEKEEKTNS